MFEQGDKVKLKDNIDGIDTYGIPESYIKELKDRVLIVQCYIPKNFNAVPLLFLDGVNYVWNANLFEGIKNVSRFN
jgi:hypothetical protein